MQRCLFIFSGTQVGHWARDKLSASYIVCLIVYLKFEMTNFYTDNVDSSVIALISAKLHK